MNTQTTPQAILRELAQIQSLDRGSLHVIRQGPSGPYYNHQCYEDGKKVTRYVPTEQVPDLKAALANYQRFQQLTQQYVQLLVDQTRADRAAGSKKKTPPLTSSSPKIKKSNS
jgi:hypothetical protein